MVNKFHQDRIVQKNLSWIPKWKKFFIKLYLPFTQIPDYQDPFPLKTQKLTHKKKHHTIICQDPFVK